MIQLPPDGLDDATVAAWLEQVAEHVEEFQRTGYEVVLVADGRHDEALAAARRCLSTPSSRRRRAG